MRIRISSMMIPVAGLAAVACSRESTAPNILYVFPDQFRNCALGFWNEPEYEGCEPWRGDPTQTPNLNRFAGESLVLTRAVSSFPVSSPYRGSFLTGMYPERSGITLNCMALRPESSLRDDAVCISDVLSGAGYSCGYIGKLHANAPTKNDPDNPGHYVKSDREPVWDAYTPPQKRHHFDYWYSYGTFDRHKDPHYWDTDGVFHEPHEYSPKHETDRAIDYLRNRNGERDASKPFFLVVAYNPPHAPYESMDDCMEEDYRIYADRSLTQLYVRDNADTTMAKAPAARYYFANVTGVDREFGRLLRELGNLGLDRNTIVVFTSDHGETLCSHGTDDPKNSPYTESYNVPFIIRYPGRIRHRTDAMMLSTTDIMPTLLSLAGLRDRIPSSVEGRDLSAAMLCGGKECPLPTSTLYIRNIDGDRDEDGCVRSFFPESRGIMTDRYTMSITITKDLTVKDVLIFDNVEDPYQMRGIPFEENPRLFSSLCKVLRDKLEEADDIWFRDGILDKLNFNL